MKVPVLLLGGGALILGMQAAHAQAPGFVMWSAADLAQRDAALAEGIRPDGSARETLADYGNPSGAHRFRFIRRDADGFPEQHVHIEDVVFVRSGAGTLVVGGELIGRSGTRRRIPRAATSRAACTIRSGPVTYSTFRPTRRTGISCPTADT